MRDALENMRMARTELNLAFQDVRNLLQGFFGRRRQWSGDLEATLSWTQKRGRVALVVDKLNHTLHIVRGGRSVKAYPAEFGPGWLQQKNREGDNATPEGRYEVVRKMSRGQTLYYKAVLLDYPNARDTARFERLRASGALGSSARIGGLIEIHGSGGKGEDWTFGCVSLRNEHMDEIYPILSVGTPVTIVGVWEEPLWLTRVLETASR
jgi:lipoprotein-anchoring transpeptidase ErfK/SrfK